MLDTACPTPKTRPHYASAYRQAIVLQELLMQSAKGDATTPSALAQVARAWSDLEERKRILRMKPAPKPVDVSQKPKRVKRQTAPQDTGTFPDAPADPGA